jgi:hypothetical protein
MRDGFVILCCCYVRMIGLQPPYDACSFRIFKGILVDELAVILTGAAQFRKARPIRHRKTASVIAYHQ